MTARVGHGSHCLYYEVCVCVGVQENGKVFSPEMPFCSKFVEILYTEIRSPRGDVYVTDHLRLPLMRHPATLITMPILALENVLRATVIFLTVVLVDCIFVLVRI